MSERRRRLPNRRANETFAFECNGLHYLATISFFPGTCVLAEVFLSNAKAGSHSDSAAKDSAVVASLALQHNVPLETIRRALMRNADGTGSGPLACALDIIAAEDSR
jgi:hypothetical protein